MEKPAWRSLHGRGESKVQTNFQCPHFDQSELDGCEWCKIMMETSDLSQLKIWCYIYTTGMLHPKKDQGDLTAFPAGLSP